MHISKKFFIHKGVWAALAVLLLLGLTLLSLCVGSVNLSLAEVFGALADVDSPAQRWLRRVYCYKRYSITPWRRDRSSASTPAAV